MDRQCKLDLYYATVGVNSLKAREIIRELDFDKDAYLLSCIALTYKDEAMFFKSGKRRVKFKTDKIYEAKKYIDRAFEINQTCRDVLYTKGEIYNALGDKMEAVDCYIKILEFGENTTQYNCSESDLSFVKMLLNDTRFQLYRLFFDLEAYELSNNFLASYTKNVEEGTETIYKPIEAFLMSPASNSIT